MAPVDTNLFPAGFQQFINTDYIPLYIPPSCAATIAEICLDVTRLLLIPRELFPQHLLF
ncbi:glutamate--cysteine ligase [Coxiella-like endosymbiont]|uniref:glutamate--cysteine ligase n=1 Tax=Coxiella-like endosymbiont TaxID=1592897 RepID=UPI00272CAF0F|nr:glutamate--cysteine ligase [Coxiella-like endosymbiont]